MSEEIININELEKNENPKNSDYILSIIEVCNNPLKYKLSKSNTNTTKKFWDEVVEHEKFKIIFKAFKSETLRKYWRCIREAKDNNTYIQLVKKHSKIIDNPVFKLLPVIHGITNFIKTKQNDFDEFFKNLHKNNKKIEVKEENKNLKNNNNIIYNMLNQKRNEPLNDNKEDKNGKKSTKNNEEKKEEKNEQKIEEKNEQKIEDKNEQKIEEKNEQKNEEKNEEKIEENNEDIEIEEKESKEDNNEIKNCDEMINSLQKFFPESNRKELFNILYQTSGNIKYAYLYLSDPEKNDKYCFVQTDDYIIQNLRDKSYYQTLIEQKGIDLIREREIFLNLKNN